MNKEFIKDATKIILENFDKSEELINELAGDSKEIKNILNTIKSIEECKRKIRENDNAPDIPEITPDE